MSQHHHNHSKLWAELQKFLSEIWHFSAWKTKSILHFLLMTFSWGEPEDLDKIFSEEKCELLGLLQPTFPEIEMILPLMYLSPAFCFQHYAGLHPGTVRGKKDLLTCYGWATIDLKNIIQAAIQHSHRAFIHGRKTQKSLAFGVLLLCIKDSDSARRPDEMECGCEDILSSRSLQS